MDYSLPGSSVQGISQVRLLERVAIFYSKGSSRPRDRTRISCTGRQILYHLTTWEALLEHNLCVNIPYPLVSFCKKNGQ